MLTTSFFWVSSLVVGALGAARTTAPSGAIVVAESSGDFTSIQAAVDSISSSGAVIFVQPGTYEEQVLIPDTVGALTIYGYTEDDQDYSKNQVTLTHSLGADEAGNNDSSGTLRAKNDGLKVYNVNVVNSRGKGVQAIALSAYGSEQGYYGCQFTGYQDTILSNEGYHYFHGSYIEGATDFIFGQEAIAWFESCTIGISGNGYITASGRDSDDNPSWYVINKSTVEALSGVSEGATVLGRPWRTYARVVFQNSELGSVVSSVGWSAWGDNPTDNVYYGEFGNTGDGASGERVSFAQQLSSAVSIDDILGTTSWLDSDYISGTGSSDETTASVVVSETEQVGGSTTPAAAPSQVFETAAEVTPSSSVVPDVTTNPASSSGTPESSTDDCSGTPDGFASLNGGTTGGSGGEIVTVSTQEDLEKYAAAEGKYVIKVAGTITITPKGTEVVVVSDKTIVGIGADAEINEGGFNLQNQANVIFRNIKIGNTYVEGDEEGKTQDWDGIQMDNCTNIWIDHVHLEHGGDGLIDSRKDTTFLTVSWTILRNHNKAFGIGWTDNAVSQVTIHHNFFDETTQRNPSVDNVKYAHLYNNYLVGQTSYGHYARGETEMRMENCYFEDVKNPITMDDTAKLDASGNVFDGTSGTTAENSGDVFDPADFYEYTLDAAEDVPTVVGEGAGRQASICSA
ncbi:pectin lyase fold/virulence factor [Dactylonectria macrodidyma]|uniref:pectinesterase n=1 Tax=Dactylonectria macrodidyma TaxID=307937 RepID=A0A9P9FL28_9HYPO|nr:pectin lyase fold/virulence factor [Dactylonectria macrodidyma]